jgi:hypothetical protein
MAAGADVVEAGFGCRRCGAPAGTVAFLPADADYRPLDRLEHSELSKASPRLFVTGPVLTACHSLIGRLADKVDQVRAAVAAGDAAAVHALGRELAPFWCPGCAAAYCREHWTLQAVFDEAGYDYTTGRCPRGHLRIVNDR